MSSVSQSHQYFPDKPAARRYARSVWSDFLADRDLIPRWSGHLAGLLNGFSAARPDARLLAYIPLADEPDHRAVWRDFPGRVYLPVIGSEHDMSFRLFLDGGRQQCALRTGRFKLEEPEDGATLAGPLTADDIVLMPGLAAAPDGTRLGRGGGFYDRWRERLNPACLISVVPAALSRLDFPPEVHDLRLNRVVTELGLVDY